MVEHNLAKVGVAGSNPVVRSTKQQVRGPLRRASSVSRGGCVLRTASRYIRRPAERAHRRRIVGSLPGAGSRARRRRRTRPRRDRRRRRRREALPVESAGICRPPEGDCLGDLSCKGENRFGFPERGASYRPGAQGHPGDDSTWTPAQGAPRRSRARSLRRYGPTRALTGVPRPRIGSCSSAVAVQVERSDRKGSSARRSIAATAPPLDTSSTAGEAGPSTEWPWHAAVPDSDIRSRSSCSGATGSGARKQDQPDAASQGLPPRSTAASQRPSRHAAAGRRRVCEGGR